MNLIDLVIGYSGLSETKIKAELDQIIEQLGIDPENIDLDSLRKIIGVYAQQSFEVLDNSLESFEGDVH